MNSNIANSMSSRDKNSHDPAIFKLRAPSIFGGILLVDFLYGGFGWVQMRLVDQRNLKTIPVLLV
jgi:hypothetical protein